MEDRNRNADNEWTCPDCRSQYNWEDGIRYCTRSQVCKCLEMPLEIKVLRWLDGRPVINLKVVIEFSKDYEV